MSARAGRRGKGRKWIGGTDEGGTKKRMMVEGDEREIREHNPGIKKMYKSGITKKRVTTK
jgi:hypothetical protein